MTQRAIWSTVATGAFACAAAAFVGPWVGISLSNTDGSLGVSAILAAGAVGWVSWYGCSGLFTDKPVITGTVSGFITGTVAHPVMWFLWPLLPPSSTAWFALIMPLASVYSLLFTVWITVPLAVIAGLTTAGIKYVVTENDTKNSDPSREFHSEDSDRK